MTIEYRRTNFGIWKIADESCRSERCYNRLEGREPYSFRPEIACGEIFARINQINNLKNIFRGLNKVEKKAVKGHYLDAIRNNSLIISALLNGADIIQN